jgi:hypothetical protein
MLYIIETHPSAARGVAVRDYELIVPSSEAPANEGVSDTPLAPYSFKHLTCNVCCGIVTHMNGLIICNDCGHTEGCCE